MKALLIFIASSIIYVSFAAEAAGIFKSVSGDVKIIKNSKNSSTPKVGEKFFESDTIKTGQGGSAELTDDGIMVLDAAIKEIVAKKANLVVCAGHSGSSGEKEYNMALSLKRAESAAKYLVKHGVNKEIIEVRYYADSNPLVKTAHGVPHPKNRRVEVVVK